MKITLASDLTHNHIYYTCDSCGYKVDFGLERKDKIGTGYSSYWVMRQVGWYEDKDRNICFCTDCYKIKDIIE